MIQVLAAIGSGSTLALVGVVVWLVYKSLRAKDDLLAARDMLDKTREELRAVRGELESETAAHAVTTDELKDEKQLRASVEAERNDAYRRARDQFAAQIKKAGVADAIKLVDNLLALPLPRVVREDKVVPAGDPEDRTDDLLEPEV